jgi:hypothetical protein
LKLEYLICIYVRPINIQCRKKKKYKLFYIKNTKKKKKKKKITPKSIAERSHYCECGQLETVEHILRDCALHYIERSCLRKVSPELDLQVLLDTKKGLGAVVKLLNSLP